MSLFHPLCPVIGETTVPPFVKTPIGPCNFLLSIQDHSITDNPPTQSFLLSSGASLLCWEHSQYQAELLICSIETLPLFYGRQAIIDTMPWNVDACWAGIWRLQAHSLLSSYIFSARVFPTLSPLSSSPNAGQYLEAHTWGDDDLQVTLGTQDYECLTPTSNLVPARWWPHLDWDIAAYLDDGISITLPPLEPGEQCQIQFLTAWGGGGSDCCDTWMAVNLLPRAILASAQCQ
jgi:hypothetical protein